jgi:hypothetical protein
MVVKIDRRTGREWNQPISNWTVYLFLVGGFGIWLLLGGVAFLISREGIALGIALLLLGLITAGTCLFAFIQRMRKYYEESRKHTDKITKYKHECLLCGYKWERRENEPLPEVHVRPDLIAAGDRLRRQADSCKVCGYPVGENVRFCPYCSTARW